MEELHNVTCTNTEIDSKLELMQDIFRWRLQNLQEQEADEGECDDMDEDPDEDSEEEEDVQRGMLSLGIALENECHETHMLMKALTSKFGPIKGDMKPDPVVTPQPMAESSGHGTERNRLSRSFHNNYLYNPVKDTSHTVSRINKHIITDNN